MQQELTPAQRKQQESLAQALQNNEIKLQWNVHGRAITILLVGDYHDLSEFFTFLAKNMSEYTIGDPVIKDDPKTLEGRLQLGSRKLFHVKIEHWTYERFEKVFHTESDQHSLQYDGILIYWKKDYYFCDYKKAESLYPQKRARRVGYFNPKNPEGSNFTWIWWNDGEEYWEIKLRSFIKRTQSHLFDEESPM
jgi:hypothetical protein